MSKTETDIKKVIKKDVDIQNIKKKENWGGELMYWILFLEYLDKEYTQFYLAKYTLEYNTIDNVLYYRKLIPTIDLLHTKLNFTKLQEPILNEYTSNIDKRFIIFSLSLTGIIGHQNALLIDTKKMEAEIFEPYGDINKVHGVKVDILNKEKFYESIKNFLKALSPDKKIKLFSPENFLPPKSLQEIEETECIKDVYKVDTDIGFCVAWTMFYLEHRIKNPNKNRNDIIKYIMAKVKKGKTDKYICQLIRKYSLFLINLYKSKSFKERLKTNLIFKWKYYLLKTFQFSFLTLYSIHLYIKPIF